MAFYEHLPIYKKSIDLNIWFEKIVRNFSRYNKYTLGTEARNLSRNITMMIVKANSAREKLPVLLDIRQRLEELKILIRVAKETKALKSFKSFEYAMREIVDISRQNEGWIRSQKEAKEQITPGV
ncbi:MAG: four helix bundle protein [Candidatus Omnitrophica bacterium]|jgi:hypothetical protein|nr:four helix bundle protein [Candidatus Omnitrophota bacterium]